ncbi:hypothetical protein PQG02_16585 [Nostoc sp. UHCC 0926]|nr:hypothetical protein [Nostoc sp. UHCC 0926]WDD30398.1 hypothetical protein PQG02_16585 [Nostoc sp. UHCC 0926]
MPAKTSFVVHLPKIAGSFFPYSLQRFSSPLVLAQRSLKALTLTVR